MNEHLQKASDILKEAHQNIPSLFDSMENELKSFYNELSPKTMSCKEMDPENMLKYNILNYLEENEPQHAQRFQDVIDFEKGQLALTRKYIETPSIERLAQLDPPRENDGTALA